ncbi:hypothetical protein SCP_1005100 [Sparassis crispa]|uniref:Uncharacterized protein n=1 Tax=Sparassis crispa TaxID=139825 RepID=A0A401GYM2_9APHY|nr:hypothetical protein SCP_1005100 [Sparassis crispa]GBE87263.1 hypothetical protein SCP_1005100 [Sparassis crispa]
MAGDNLKIEPAQLERLGPGDSNASENVGVAAKDLNAKLEEKDALLMEFRTITKLLSVIGPSCPEVLNKLGSPEIVGALDPAKRPGGVRGSFRRMTKADDDSDLRRLDAFASLLVREHENVAITFKRDTYPVVVVSQDQMASPPTTVTIGHGRTMQVMAPTADADAQTGKEKRVAMPSSLLHGAWLIHLSQEKTEQLFKEVKENPVKAVVDNALTQLFEEHASIITSFFSDYAKARDEKEKSKSYQMWTMYIYVRSAMKMYRRMFFTLSCPFWKALENPAVEHFVEKELDSFTFPTSKPKRGTDDDLAVYLKAILELGECPSESKLLAVCTGNTAKGATETKALYTRETCLEFHMVLCHCVLVYRDAVVQSRDTWWRVLAWKDTCRNAGSQDCCALTEWDLQGLSERGVPVITNKAQALQNMEDAALVLMVAANTIHAFAYSSALPLHLSNIAEGLMKPFEEERNACQSRAHSSYNAEMKASREADAKARVEEKAKKPPLFDESSDEESYHELSTGNWLDGSVVSDGHTEAKVPVPELSSDGKDGLPGVGNVVRDKGKACVEGGTFPPVAIYKEDEAQHNVKADRMTMASESDALNEGNDECESDLGAVMSSITPLVDRVDLKMAFERWFRLQASFPESIRILQGFASKSPWKGTGKPYEVHVVTAEHQGQGMLSIDDLINKLYKDSPRKQDVSRYFQRHPSIGSKVGTTFLGTLHAEAFMAAIVKSDPDYAVYGQDKLGVSKRCCPVCTAVLVHIRAETKAPKFKIRGTHATVSACALPPWLPLPIVQKIVDLFRTELMEKINAKVDSECYSWMNSPTSVDSHNLQRISQDSAAEQRVITRSFIESLFKRDGVRGGFTPKE